MSYTKQNFTTGQVLKASHLNYIENGISENADAIEQLNNNFLNQVYPIGSIYMSISNTNPSNLFGGEWEQIKDRFLLASGSTYTAGTTGGAANVTLTEAQMPKHAHKDIYVDGTKMSWCAGKVASGANYGVISNIVSTGNGIYVGNAGSGEPHENMPPYLAVYMWKRTA